jgi:hypothetical protein
MKKNKSKSNKIAEKSKKKPYEAVSVLNLFEECYVCKLSTRCDKNNRCVNCGYKKEKLQK